MKRKLKSFLFSITGFGLFSMLHAVCREEEDGRPSFSLFPGASGGIQNARRTIQCEEFSCSKLFSVRSYLVVYIFVICSVECAVCVEQQENFVGSFHLSHLVQLGKQPAVVLCSANGLWE